MTKTGRIATAIALGLFSGQAVAQDESDPATMIDRIVAIVNDGIVLQTELDTRVEAIKKSADVPVLPPEDELREQILDSLIVRQAQLQLAERRQIAVSDAELNQALAGIADRNNLTLEQLPATLAEDGIDYNDYREEIRFDMVIDKLIQVEVYARVRVSEREIEHAMEDFNQGRAGNREYDISHILFSIPAGATRAEIVETRDTAFEVYTRLINDAEFTQMAVAYSSGLHALEGGRLGWLRGLEVPTLLSHELSKLEPGYVTEPLQSASGFHIFKINDVRGGEQILVTETSCRHILITPSAVLAPDAAKERLEGIRQRIAAGEDFAELAHEFSDDPGSASDGGDLGWRRPGAFVPQFEDPMAELEIGELSEVITTPFGYHIIEVLGRRDVDSAEDIQRERVAQLLRQRKAQENAQLWLLRLRDDAYVEIRL